MYKNTTFLISSIVLAVIVISLGLYWILYLQKAHSTFENYFAFRGCQTLLERTDTYGTCKLANGSTIKIVKYDNKWFLDGDLPECAIGIGSICLINWP